MLFTACLHSVKVVAPKELVGLVRALKKVLLTKDSQINTNEGCSRFFDILHFFLFSSR